MQTIKTNQNEILSWVGGSTIGTALLFGSPLAAFTVGLFMFWIVRDSQIRAAGYMDEINWY